MFERITEKTFDEIFPLLESAFPVTELRMKEDQRALLKEPCYRLYGVRREGVFAATFATWEIEDFLYIEHFAVKEEYRNRRLRRHASGCPSGGEKTPDGA